tara:strand:+ start:748 stop:1347 length:600 start_codon:yes stop_codon:yes gene_type:complete
MNNHGGVKVFVYNRESYSWKVLGAWIHSNSETRMLFGISVALSADGRTLAAGAPGVVVGPQGGYRTTVDQVLTYTWDGTSERWERTGRALGRLVQGKMYTVRDHLGWSVALSADGRTLAAGAPRSSNGTGSVRLFVRDTTSAEGWTQSVPDIVGTAPYEQYGASVAVGARGETLVGSGGLGVRAFFLAPSPPLPPHSTA